MEDRRRLGSSEGSSGKGASHQVSAVQGLLGRPRAQRRASAGGKWTPQEDAALKDIVQIHGAKNWKNVRVEVSCHYSFLCSFFFMLC
jgi:hypothetical protein